MIEMMFAILILSIVILGLLGVLGSVLRNQSEGRTYEKVSIAANTVFGQAGQALADDFEKVLVPDVFPAGRQPVTGLEEEVTFEISETRERDDLKRIDITLYWKDKDGQEHSKALSTKFVKGV
jgi:hypothetical protein